MGSFATASAYWLSTRRVLSGDIVRLIAAFCPHQLRTLQRLDGRQDVQVVHERPSTDVHVHEILGEVEEGSEELDTLLVRHLEQSRPPGSQEVPHSDQCDLALNVPSFAVGKSLWEWASVEPPALVALPVAYPPVLEDRHQLVGRIPAVWNSLYIPAKGRLYRPVDSDQPDS